MIEHFVDQRQLAILDRQFLGARGKEAVCEVLDTAVVYSGALKLTRTSLCATHW
jgi:hypothetical protein